MFYQEYGNLTIRTAQMPKRGTCLQAAFGTNYILMDFCGMNSMLVPDGTNAYFFGNKLILVTRWSDMTDEEKALVQRAPLRLAIHPYRYLQFSLRVGENWGDVMVNLFHCLPQWNDESRPVDEIIFLFADTHDEDFVISRSVALPGAMQSFLQQANRHSHEGLPLENEYPALCAEADQDPSRDVYDLIYDLCFEASKSYSRAARAQDFDAIPGGIYLDVDGTNRIVNLYQRRENADANGAAQPAPQPAPAPQPKPEISPEVLLYMELADKGIAEGQYNLGYCYEHGDGVAQDAEKAIYWYRTAAEQGYAKAQYNLGTCIYNGFGAPQDFTEAARLFGLAAEQGDMYAQFNMGVCCYNGAGVEKDVLKAVEWFRKAARQGHPEALKILGGQ